MTGCYAAGGQPSTVGGQRGMYTQGRFVRRSWRIWLLANSTVLLAFLAGCATAPPQLSRDEWLKLQTRGYEGVTADAIYKAAEQLFRLADGDDFSFAYSAKGAMQAHRRWLIYAVLSFVSGVDEWNLHVETKDGAPVASIDVTRRFGMFLGGTQNQLFQSAALYDLFWARMDYLLGRTSTWRTCAEQKERIDRKETWGLLDPLCEVTIADDGPSPR